MDVVIPKLHVYSHKLKCQTDYSLNYLCGAGRTDGEGIERTHSNTGPVCASTKQMGPDDGLDWHWTHWNWQKIVGFGNVLVTCWKRADALHGRNESSVLIVIAHMKLEGKKNLFVPFMICVHILQGITFYFYTPSDLVDLHFRIYHP
jgi:hypothetical protein